MKKIIVSLSCIFLILSLQTQAQKITIPKLSPFQKTTIKIGIVDVELSYSRPSMREREIFGELVPFGKIWRTGANKNTKIVFNDKVQIGNSILEAGTYTIFTKPDEEKWEIYFHTELDEYGAPEILDDKNIKAKIIIPVVKLNRDIETLSIAFESLKSESAILAISWERTYIPIKIEIPTADLMEKKLTINRLALASTYSNAAWNYFDILKDNEKALKAINKSIELKEGEQTFEEWLTEIDLDDWSLPWAYRTKSEIHAALGDKKSAIAAAKKSLIIAKKLNSGEAYIKRNTINIEKWENK